MLTLWNDYSRDFALLEGLRRRMDRLFEEYDSSGAGQTFHNAAGWPRTNLFDADTRLIAHVDVPGLSEKDIQISVNNDILTLIGERKSSVPEGYTAHRQERTMGKFVRSFSLPTRVDLDKTTATVKDGVLTISLAKAPEAQPRKIPIRTK